MALWPFTVNGISYNLVDFDALAYVSGIPNSLLDLANHVNRPFNSSGSSITLGTGSKTVSAAAGLNIRVGDYVMFWLSDNNWCSGPVTAYNPSTGSMTANCDTVTGAGTGVVRVVKMGESTLSNSVVAPLDPSIGGTGAGGNFSGARATAPGAQFGSSLGGIGSSAWDAMFEVYEDFFAFDVTTPARSVSDAPANWLASPYFISNCSFLTKPIGFGGRSGGNRFGGSISIQPTTLLTPSAIFTHGQKGYVLPGGGTLRYECLVSIVNDINALAGPTRIFKTPTFRFGLRGQGSGSSGNIFSYSGIGFERLANNGGKLNVYIGKNGFAYRQVIPFTMSEDTYTMLSFVVAADGNLVDFYVGDILAATVIIPAASQVPTGTYGIQNLLHPGFEVQSNGGTNVPAMEIESFWLRKNIQR